MIKSYMIFRDQIISRIIIFSMTYNVQLSFIMILTAAPVL